MKKLALMIVASMFLYGCASTSHDKAASVIPVDLQKSELIQVLSEKSDKKVLDVEYLLSKAEMTNEDMVEFREQLILALGQEQINNSFIPQSEINNLAVIAKGQPEGCYVKEGYEYYSPQLQDDVMFVIENMRVCVDEDSFVSLDTSIGDFRVDVKYGDTVMATSREASYFHNYVKSAEHTYSSLAVGKLTLNEDMLSFETESGVIFEVDDKGVVTRSDIGLIGVIH